MKEHESKGNEEMKSTDRKYFIGKNEIDPELAKLMSVESLAYVIMATFFLIGLVILGFVN